ncbi:MAG: hypothetical protein H0T46_30990 [Deltaproteobacteria bacterium]|nr:hypothetical protein [Deltaproteobacteria bacterium]
MGNLRRALTLLLFVAPTLTLSCGGKQKTGTTDTGGGTGTSTKNYDPLTIKDDSKLANQAVILGTDEKNGSTVLPLPAMPSKGLVDAMFVKIGGMNPASGGSTPVKLSTAPNTDGSVQVGIYEEMAGGTGAQWRAGVWVSAFVAANVLNKDLTDFTFTAASGGFIDGASASGLMAGGFLATMTGQKIDANVTMTGIINPDGTIGPVGGIPEKFIAAIEKGKKKLGYPIGMRWTKSEATGKIVDLVQIAKDKGAEAVEVSNVYQAYTLLTGKKLPEAVPVSEAEMALDPETTKALDEKYQEWKQRLAGEWAALLQLQQAGRLPTTLTVMARYAQEMADRAEKLHRSGHLAAAYAKMLMAWVYAASATDTYDILAKVQGGDSIGAVAALASLDQLDSMTVDVFNKIGAIKPATLGQHLLMIHAFQAALRAWGFKVYATDALGRTKSYLASLSGATKAELAAPEVADKIVLVVAPTVLLIGRTVAETMIAQQELEFEKEPSVNYTCSIPNVKRMATSFQSAGVAGINYFDTLLIEPLAKEAAMTVEDARTRIALREPNYLVAYMLSHLTQVDGLPKQLRQKWGDGSVAWALLSLAGSELAYYHASELVAKYYSLGVKTDAMGRPDTVEHDKAFTNMLASAERSARASARAARIATGGIPVQAKLAYQLASVEREGDLGDKLSALASYWQASAFSQTAVMLARN